MKSSLKTALPLALLALLVPASADADTGGSAYVPGQVLVRFRGHHPEQTLRLPASVGVGAATRALRRNPAIDYAAPNYIAHAAGGIGFPNDPGRAGTPGGWSQMQWSFLNTPAGIGARPAWRNLRKTGHPGGEGVTVAVIDTGVAYRALGLTYKRDPDLAPGRFVRGFDYVSNDRIPLDLDGHGTHVASTIGEQTNNGRALTGIAYRTKLMPIRVLNARGHGPARQIAKGINFARRNGADVLNLSFEFPRNRVDSCADIPGVCRALRLANHAGDVVVAATGNESAHRVDYPARFASVIGVGGTTEDGCKAEYSNQGKGLDLVAPGGGSDSMEACPDSAGGGRPIFQLTFKGGGFTTFGYPSHFYGTSMAAAHVSGVVALLLASGLLPPAGSPDQLPAEVLARLQSTAKDLGVPGPDPFYAAGLVDASAATAPPPSP